MAERHSERPRKKEDRVAVLQLPRTPRVVAIERNVAGKLAMQPGQVGLLALGPSNRPGVVDHRAADPKKSVTRVEQLDEPCLAGPIHHRAGRHLPEAVST